MLSRDTNPSSSPIPEYTLNATAVSTSFSASQDPSSLFVTAQESSLQAGQDQVDSWAETHGKEELAGSYCYASTGISMAASGDELSGAEQPDRLSPNGAYDTN